MLLGTIKTFALFGTFGPEDPANYWTMDTISVADSKPSAYASWDLTRQGYQVKDSPRYLKTIIEAAKTLLSLEYQVKNLTPLSNSELLQHYDGVTNILTDTNNTTNAYSGLMSQSSLTVWNKGFRRTEYTSGGKIPTAAEKIEADKKLLSNLEKTYKDTAETAKNLGGQAQEIQLLTEALERLESVNGNLDNQQIAAQVESIKASLTIKRNILLANYLGLEAVNGQADIDAIERDRRDVRNGGAFLVSDPYQPSPYDQKILENNPRPKGIGFVDFK